MKNRDILDPYDAWRLAKDIHLNIIYYNIYLGQLEG